MAKKLKKKKKAPEAASVAGDDVPLFAPVYVAISDLKPHPENYKTHGPEQLQHIVASLRANGFYKNVVVARDNTILAGHGVVEGSKILKLKKVPVIRLPVDPFDPDALRVVAGDNEISKLAETDDRALSELLKKIIESDDSEALLGTGFDEKQLANLVFVTRDASEIADLDAAKEWVGLPAYDEEDETKESELSLVVTFKTAEDRERFVKEKALKIRDTRGGRKWSTVWPFVEKNDLRSVKFEGEEEASRA